VSAATDSTLEDSAISLAGVFARIEHARDATGNYWETDNRNCVSEVALSRSSPHRPILVG
jgi:hypothetical protein